MIFGIIDYRGPDKIYYRDQKLNVRGVLERGEIRFIHGFSEEIPVSAKSLHGTFKEDLKRGPF